jgi:hypothetical protein
MKMGPWLISPVLFVAACCLPALEFNIPQGGEGCYMGGTILAVGWSGIFAGVFGWYANPFWLLGLVLVLVRQRWFAAAAGTAAIAIGCTTISMFGQALPTENQMTLVRLLPGFYIWMASLVSLPVLAMTREPALRQAPTEPRAQ